MNMKKKIKAVSAGVALMAPLVCSADLLGIEAELTGASFNYNNGGVTTFDAGTGNFVINASPTEFAADGVNFSAIFDLGTSPSVAVSLFLDDNCGLTGGDPGAQDLIVSGDIDTNFDFVPEYSGVLLTAEVVEFGVAPTLDVDGSALYDARFAITGGSLVTAGVYTAGEKVGLTVRSEGSDFGGSCMTNHGGGAKGVIGSVPDAPEPEKCFDIKKVWVKDANAYKQCYGWGSSYYGSRFKVMLAAECEDGFDPTNDLISVSLDGETIEFSPGTFIQDFDNPSRFEASISGRPTVRASLDCAEGWFSIYGSKADISQIDFNDGIDVTLVLGDWTKTMNAPVTPSKTYGGYNLSWKYWNTNPADCSNPDYTPPACVTSWESVKFKHIDSGEYFTFDGDMIGSEISLSHDYVDNGASCSAVATVDSSCGTAVTCGDIINGYKVMRIEHKDDHQSCDITSHYDSYHYSKGKRKHRWRW